jgi:hypothetical protein
VKALTPVTARGRDSLEIEVCLPPSLQGATIFYDDLAGGASAVAANTLHLFDNVQAVNHLTKNNVLTVQPARNVTDTDVNFYESFINARLAASNRLSVYKPGIKLRRISW